jgi:uncharacterized protein YbbC (DUF1343 family)
VKGFVGLGVRLAWGVLVGSVLLLAAPQPAAERPQAYLPLLQGKRVGVVVNHASLVGKVHLVDLLLSYGVRVEMIFAPEHGFRGKADAGEPVKHQRDPRTGLPVISLYGAQRKPQPAQLDQVDLILFDLQDVGVRFYTYLSTLHYLMESAAESSTPLVLLDRPNPNGHYVDGPVLRSRYRSFVGLHPVPIVYGMTIGEYAQMINGEGWLGDGVRADLTVVPLEGYTHQMPYALPVRPSPNLPTSRAVALYPSLALFEGTVFSVGRGTEAPFERYGHPDYPDRVFSFTPHSGPGARHPKLQDQKLYGENLSKWPVEKIRKEARINLSYLLKAYRTFPDPEAFFLPGGFFEKLAGTDALRHQIRAGWSEAEIRESWKSGLEAFRVVRQRYLLYP